MIEDENENPSEQKEKSPIKQKIIVALSIAAAALIMIEGAHTLNKMSGGSESIKTDLVDKNTAINQITISADANIRLDPAALKGENDNRLAHPEEQIVVNIDDNDVVTTENNNGTWYGIPAEDLEKAAPSIKTEKDNDGIIWVNEDGAKVTGTNKN